MTADRPLRWLRLLAIATGAVILASCRSLSPAVVATNTMTMLPEPASAPVEPAAASAPSPAPSPVPSPAAKPTAWAVRRATE